jgi:hypothetical protein
MRLLVEQLRADEIGRQRDDAGQALRMAQSGEQRDGPALGETGQHDARRRDAARRFALDQRFDLLLRAAHALDVRAIRMFAARTSYHARMRKPWLIVTGITGACGNRKRTRSFARSCSAGTTSDQPRPSSPRTMHPDHRGVRLAPGFDFDCVEKLVGHAWNRVCEASGDSSRTVAPPFRGSARGRPRSDPSQRCSNPHRPTVRRSMGVKIARSMITHSSPMTIMPSRMVSVRCHCTASIVM